MFRLTIIQQCDILASAFIRQKLLKDKREKQRTDTTKENKNLIIKKNTYQRINVLNIKHCSYLE